MGRGYPDCGNHHDTRRAHHAHTRRQHALGAAGTEPLETTITITNIGPDSTAFVLRASSSPFEVSFVPATIAELAAGQSATATVRVAASAAGNASVVIDVVRGRDAAGTSAVLAVNFTAPPAGQPTSITTAWSTRPISLLF